LIIGNGFLQGFAVIPQSIQSRAKAMGNGDEILDHLLFWAEFFRVHDQQLALVGLAQMHQQLIPETGKPILVR
jgi:hypothetical protein